MVTITGSTYIDRPPEQVFDVVADERNEPAYNPSMTHVEKLTPGPVGVGTCWRATVLTGGRPTDLTLTVTEFSRPTRIASTATMVTGEIQGAVRFEPELSGTRLRWSWQLRPRGVLRLATPIIALLGHRQERAIWAGLKRHLEGAEGSRP